MAQTKGTSRRNFLKTAAVSSLAAGVGGQALVGRVDAEEAISDTVPRRQLGTTGETIPILLVGCAMKFDPKYDKILHRAYKAGVNYLDTALRYADGQSPRPSRVHQTDR
jgi:anaerobic selenocysteine-containing dehydrogenase